MSKTHLTVLGFLNEKPMYGYEIAQVIKERGMNQWAGINLPSVYKALLTLEEKKYISGKRIAEGNNPPKTVYRLTATGKEYLKKLVEKMLSKPKTMVDFWLAVAFMLFTIEKKFVLNAIDNLLEKIIKLQKKHSFSEDKKLPFNYEILRNFGQDMAKENMKILRQLKAELLKPETDKYFPEEK